MQTRQINFSTAAIALAFVAYVASTSVCAATVVIGQVAPLSGPDASQGRDYAAGMQLLFRSVNRSGGVNGHTFTLVTKDDGGRVEDTLELTRQILAESRPIVLAGYLGNRNVEQLARSGLLEKHKIALVGYRALDVWSEHASLFSVRASLNDELTKFVEYLATVGVTRLGLFYEQGDSAAKLIAGTEDAAKGRGAALVSKASYEAGTNRVSDAIDVFIKDRPQAIVLVCNGQVAARFIERYRTDGGAAQLFVYSGADMESVTRQIAEHRLAFVTTAMQGVVIAEVVPNPYHVSSLARDVKEAAAREGKPDMRISYVTMEGYIAAKVVVEAVRRQGPRPTREGMSAALESINRMDLGSYVVGFKTGTRIGSRFVELTVISDTGRIRR